MFHKDKRKDYTREEALEYLRREGTISTLCLNGLGVSFEQFLRFAQLPTEAQSRIVARLLEEFTK